jgi:carboxypeptidase PM20D1
MTSSKLSHSILSKSTLLLALALLVGVIIFNTARNTSRQPPYVPMPIDDRIEHNEDIIQKFAHSIVFSTISYENKKDMIYDKFLMFHKYLENNFPLLHKTLKKTVVNEFSLVYEWPGTYLNLKPILLMGHQDVVPVENGTETLKWDVDPFAGEIKDGYIIGRGTMDQKLAVLGTMEAVEHLIKRSFRPTRTVYLAFGHDEEIGGQEGAKHVARMFQERGISFEFILDEGLPVLKDVVPGVQSHVALVGVAEKGRVFLELSVRSAGGHGSMPPKHTAIGIMAQAINKLENNRMPAKLTNTIRTMLEYLAPEIHSWPLRIIASNLWIFERPVLYIMESMSNAANALIRTTTSVSLVHGGTKINVLPNKVVASIDHRVIPTETVEDLIEHHASVINDASVHIEVTESLAAAPETPVGTPAYIHIAKSIRRTFGELPVIPGLMIGSTDTAHFWHLSHNIFRLSPMVLTLHDTSRIHGFNERISIEGYYKAIEFYLNVIKHSASL